MGSSSKGVGIPVKLLHEGEGHVVTVELKSGEIYRGELFDAEDNWNLQLKDVTATGRDGRVTQLDHIFVRGRCGRACWCRGRACTAIASSSLQRCVQHHAARRRGALGGTHAVPPRHRHASHSRACVATYAPARSRIRFILLPDMLKNAPMFKRIDPRYKGKALPMGVGGRGRAAQLRAAAKAKGR